MSNVLKFYILIQYCLTKFLTSSETLDFIALLFSRPHPRSLSKGEGHMPIKSSVSISRLFFSRTILILIFFFGFISHTKADVGETFDLKYKRQLLLQNLNKNDSSIQELSKEELINSINNYKALLELDNKIFSSYQSTVHRTAYHEYEQKANNRALVVIAFIVSLVFVGAWVLLYRQSRLLKSYTNNSYSLFSFIKEMAVLSLPLFQTNVKAYRINRLLYISILVMAVFVFMGLLSQL